MNLPPIAMTTECYEQLLHAVKGGELLLEAVKTLVADIENYVEIEDGATGPRPNWAMALLQRHPELVEMVRKAEGK